MKLDCRDMECPQPVLMVKEAYEALPEDGILDVRLNSYASIENVKRYAKNNAIYLKILSADNEETVLTLVKGYLCEMVPPAKEKRSWVLLIVGSIVSALLASTCCLAPFLFLVFGVSMGSLSFLQVLAPYHSYLALFSLAVLVYLWYDYFKHRKQKLFCETWLSKNYLKLLIGGTVIVAVLVSYPYWVTYFLDL